MPDSPQGRPECASEISALRARLKELEQPGTSTPSAAAGGCAPAIFRILVEEADEYAVLGLDRDGKITSWNAGTQRLWGYFEEEILGASVSQLYAPEDVARQSPAEELRRAAMQGRSEQEGWYVRKNSSRFVGKMAISALRDETGELYGFAVVTRYVTGRRRAEVALHESESRFRAFMNHSSAANFIEDEHGRLTFVDRTFERRFGFTAGSCLGATVFDLWPAEISQPLHENSLQVLASNESRELIETIPTNEGETTWLVCKFPFTDLSGQRFVGATAVDITEHERAKQEIEKLNVELEERVAMRTAELERSNEALRAFSYSVSHDLRAPLRAIDGFSQALIEDYGERLDPLGLDFLERVRSEAQRMGQLMDGLLNLFRVSRAELHHGPVDLSAISREIGEEWIRQEPQRPVELIVQDGLLAEGDERLLRVVLENLLENARKFTSKCSRARIEVGAESIADELPVYFVRDNGVGFDMAYADRLFGAFQRLHADTEFPGTGIGLATVQRIIHRHGGQVWAEAAADRGATFFFNLGSRTATVD